ncbi:MAG: HDOD domain-containing protein [Gammaproteobacteria bacterium]|nr:HDOD domain-containing protein [Gammaproteobacteria bacterium]
MTDKNINKWIELAEQKPVPVLKHTIKELRGLCRQEDIPIKEITHVVERDPSLVVHILHESNKRRKGRLSSEITHINQAFRLMGTDQLTRLPDALPAIGDVLEGQAKFRLLQTFNRAYHAARFATDWAALRRDMTPDEVFTATHLHFLGEMVVAMHAPELLDKIAKYKIEKHVASEEAQFLTLGFTLDELSLALAEKWQFPILVKEALHPENANKPRAYGIMLGVQLSRIVCHEGWNCNATIKIQKTVAEWLGIKLSTLINRTHIIAAEIAREIPQYDTPAYARTLPLINEYTEDDEEKSDEVPDEHNIQATLCLIPQLPLLKEMVKSLTTLSVSETTEEKLIQLILNTMHDGVGLNRVVFCHYNEEERLLKPFMIKGTENDFVFNRFIIEVNNANLFTHLIKKQQALLINDLNRSTYWKLVQPEFQKLINNNSFVVMSIFRKGKPYGLFYADRHTSNCQLDERSYNYFKTICIHTAKILEQIKN